MSLKHAIIVKDLVHSYENGSVALDNITFSVSPGEFIAIIGQNGAGKTTLVKHLNGLLKPTAGSVIVQGKDVAKEKVSTMAKKVGFVFQNPDHQIFKDTVMEEVSFGPENMGLTAQEVSKRVEEALLSVGLYDLRNASPQNLSKGQRQRVALASVLAMKTDIIVMDEPTTGQDFRESVQIMELVQKLNCLGHTILFITHDMALVARYASRAIVLCEGKLLLDGPVGFVFSQKEPLKRTYLTPPQIMELASAFPGLNSHEILTPEDLYEAVTASERRLVNGCSC